jgi:hypothetical protein
MENDRAGRRSGRSLASACEKSSTGAAGHDLSDAADVRLLGLTLSGFDASSEPSDEQLSFDLLRQGEH